MCRARTEWHCTGVASICGGVAVVAKLCLLLLMVLPVNGGVIVELPELPPLDSPEWRYSGESTNVTLEHFEIESVVADTGVVAFGVQALSSLQMPRSIINPNDMPEGIPVELWYLTRLAESDYASVIHDSVHEPRPVEPAMLELPDRGIWVGVVALILVIGMAVRLNWRQC